jgi:hypothetical protein
LGRVIKTMRRGLNGVFFNTVPAAARGSLIPAAAPDRRPCLRRLQAAAAHPRLRYPAGFSSRR